MTTQANPLIDAIDQAAGVKTARAPSAPQSSVRGNPLVDSLDKAATSLQTLPLPSSVASSQPPAQSPSLLDEAEGLAKKYIADPFTRAVRGPQEIQAINLDAPPDQVQALKQQRAQQQEQGDQPIADFGKLARAYTEGTEFQQNHPYVSGAVQSAADAVGSATTPRNLVTLAAFAAAPEGGALGIAKRLVSAGWAVGQAKDAGEQLSAAYDAHVRGDDVTAGKLLGTGTANTAMAILGGLYAGRKGTAPESTGQAETPPPLIHQPAPEGVDLSDVFDQPTQPATTGATAQPATAGRRGSNQASPAIPSSVSVVGPAEEPLAAESPDTLQAQVDALENGTNPVVYVPKGQETGAPPLPEGMIATEIPGDQLGAGTYYHSPDIEPEDIGRAVESGDTSDLLGFEHSKQQAMASRNPIAVVARDENGTELKAALVDGEDKAAIENQAQTFKKQFPDAASINLEHPDDTVLARGKDASRSRRLQGGFVSGEMLRDIANGKIAREAGQKITDDILKLGDKYHEIRKADPELGDKLQTLDNASTYYRAKAESNLGHVVDGLSRSQERLASLMADEDSRENLRLNRPDEYRQATSDPVVMRAVEAYKPLAAELTNLRQARGGQILDRDYLRRVYEQHVSGVGSAAGKPTEGAAFDRVIRPSKPSTASREASAEYHYEHGLHEFGPAYGTKYVAEKIAALRDNIARDFMEKATRIGADAELPRSIDYRGKMFYRSDVAAEMKPGTPRYAVYDPNRGIRTAIVDKESGDVTFGRSANRYLGPKKIVDTLTDYDANNKLGETGTIRNFFRQQIIGFGFGIPHVANIQRRVMQSFHGGVASPRAWAAAWKVAFDGALKERALKGVDDPRYDALLRNGGMSAGEIRNYKSYAGGNFNPLNWAKFGHDLIFKQGAIDQRARLFVADLVKSQRPEITDAELAREINKQLGDYNRANWTDRQRTLSKFMLFPGWDTSSARWVLQHPIRTSVPPAVLTLLANQVINHFGGNKTDEQYDISNVHLGDRAFNTNLIRESQARTFYRPILNFLASKIEGESNQRAVGNAQFGFRQMAQGIAGMFNPLITGAVALASNRQGLFSSKEIFGRDANEPGKILPTKGLDNLAILTVHTAFPAVDRALDLNQDVDLKSFAGANLGISNFKHDAEDRLKANAAESARAYETVSRLAKTNPDAARRYLTSDPDNAAYALFRNDFSQLAGALGKVMKAQGQVKNAPLPADEKDRRLKLLDQTRQMVLNRADVLDGALFGAKGQVRKKAAPVKQPRGGGAAVESFSPPVPSF